MENVLEKDRMFLEWLQEFHRGKDSAVKAKNMRHWGTAREIRTRVHGLRLEGYPICSGQEGYYFANTDSEVNETLSFLSSMAEETMRVAQALREKSGLHL